MISRLFQIGFSNQITGSKFQFSRIVKKDQQNEGFLAVFVSQMDLEKLRAIQNALTPQVH